jgi:hypothetical protein
MKPGFERVRTHWNPDFIAFEGLRRELRGGWES